MNRCDRCRDVQYQCPDCEERDHLEAGQLDVEREMKARSMKAAGFWRQGRR